MNSYFEFAKFYIHMYTYKQILKTAKQLKKKSSGAKKTLLAIAYYNSHRCEGQILLKW